MDSVFPGISTSCLNHFQSTKPSTKTKTARHTMKMANLRNSMFNCTFHHLQGDLLWRKSQNIFNNHWGEVATLFFLSLSFSLAWTITCSSVKINDSTDCFLETYTGNLQVSWNVDWKWYGSVTTNPNAFETVPNYELLSLSRSIKCRNSLCIGLLMQMHVEKYL